MQQQSYSKAVSRKEKLLLTAGHPSARVVLAGSGAHSEAALMSCNMERLDDMEKQKCFFFPSRASNSLAKCGGNFLVLPARLLLPFFFFLLAFSLPPSPRLLETCSRSDKKDPHVCRYQQG